MKILGGLLTVIHVECNESVFCCFDEVSCALNRVDAERHSFGTETVYQFASHYVVTLCSVLIGQRVRNRKDFPINQIMKCLRKHSKQNRVHSKSKRISTIKMNRNIGSTSFADHMVSYAESNGQYKNGTKEFFG